MTGHGSDEPPLEILKETKEPWEVRLDKLRAAESDAFLGREDAKRLRAQKETLVEALLHIAQDVRTLDDARAIAWNGIEAAKEEA